jgi:large subunit ribosomal protein L15
MTVSGLGQNSACRSFATETESSGSYTPPVRAAASLRLNDLRDNPGANKDRHRKGRGEGSGMGKYATRGMKGVKSRAGGSVRPGFEGGQSPLWRKTPKIGYMPAFIRDPMEPLNLDVLQRAVDSGRIDVSKPVTMKTLVDAGLITKIEFGVKVLGRGADKFTAKLDVEVSQVSKSAIKAIEDAGGSVKSVFYTELALRALLKPEKFDLPVKSPRPPPKLYEYYTNYENRGYLSSELQLKAVQKALAAGKSPQEAAAVMPIYAGTSYVASVHSHPARGFICCVFAGGPIHLAEAAQILPAGAKNAPLMSGVVA